MHSTYYFDVSGGTCANSGYFDCCGDPSHAVISANSGSWVACGDSGWRVGCGDSHTKSPQAAVGEFTVVTLTLSHNRRRLASSQW